MRRIKKDMHKPVALFALLFMSIRVHKPEYTLSYSSMRAHVLNQEFESEWLDVGPGQTDRKKL